MFKYQSTLIFASLCFLLVSTSLQAQNFLKVNRTLRTSAYNDIAIMANGNYVCTGLQVITDTPYVQKSLTTIFSPTGQILKEVRSHGTYDEGWAVVATPDGGFVVAGSLNSNTAQVLDGFYVIRYDSHGDSLWRKVYTLSSSNPIHAYDMKLLPDTGLVIVGSTEVGNNDYNYLVIRTDANGDTIWTYQDGDTRADYAKSVTPTRDGGFFVTGTTRTLGVWGADAFVFKLDANGNRLWYNELKNFDVSLSIASAETSSGNFLVTAKPLSPNVPRIHVLNSQGDSIGVYVHSQVANNYGRIIDDMFLNPDGTVVITGLRNDSIGGKLWIMKLDSNLDTIWSRMYGSGSISARGKGIIQTADGGYAIAGRWGSSFGALLKTDSLGNIKHAMMQGKVISDTNLNCQTDIGEIAISNQLINIATTSDTFYTISNGQGFYSVEIYDTGQVDISYQPLNSYWDKPACQPNHTLVNVMPFDTFTTDFFILPLINCPKLTVKATNSFLRRCFSNSYQINYCNEGTLTANNSYVEITLDPYMVMDYSSIPWEVPQVGNLYRFNIGNINVNQCGSFYFWATLSCTGTVIGQSHCVTAHIYPDSICEPIEPGWDLSSLTLTSQCMENDSILFTITNQGNGNMSVASQYSLIANNNIISQANFQLIAGESLQISAPADGKTYTLIVPQSIGHPGSSAPLSAQEGCTKQNGFDIGYFMQYPQDDQNPFIDIECQISRGSYDPNDKRPEPQGLGAEGYINATQPLDYTIRFQNTGTDTAFLVVLRDTLPQYLDITTLQLTGASHPYTFQIIGSNVLEWTFLNIMLPDSNVNEPASNGFVSFHIQQVDGNPVGTEIKNRAGIYFDFNESVITNYTLNTIVENYLDKITVSISEVENKGNNLQLYPNPNNGQFYIQLQQPVDGDVTFAVYDLAGKQVLNKTYNGNGPHAVAVEGLEIGMYLYKLTDKSGMISTGKVLINK